MRSYEQGERYLPKQCSDACRIRMRSAHCPQLSSPSPLLVLADVTTRWRCCLKRRWVI